MTILGFSYLLQHTLSAGGGVHACTETAPADKRLVCWDKLPIDSHMPGRDSIDGCIIIGGSSEVAADELLRLLVATWLLPEPR
jgi:hypothetical protein